MECVIGITGKDFVLVASDTIQAHSIIVMKQGEIETDLFFIYFDYIDIYFIWD